MKKTCPLREIPRPQGGQTLPAVLARSAGNLPAVPRRRAARPWPPSSPAARAICPPSPARSAGNLPAVPRPDGPSSVIGLAGDARCHLPPRGKAFPLAARAICPPVPPLGLGKAYGEPCGKPVGIPWETCLESVGKLGKTLGIMGRKPHKPWENPRKSRKTPARSGANGGDFAKLLYNSCSKISQKHDKTCEMCLDKLGIL